uniref:Uncharacterized protein n=1 Tax=Cryptomonas curvata TaxID=233186 RepID=A0A7S0QPZ8_9CRYP|mmetsp:Transcript_55577/g.116285  ORF Transcript_55577/g.116285 Transcript_55577/m.116285 type:complete len:130 (+) Transcript_55577:524-913(+)|eukprot:CAMPEP_0172195856 /NCGR_PEP_ID=MMETSP1050-20130122/26461_1 /TAXON_ID=233186 /ORGANISM="Cryptomonas curvata, Strain CCAP979/52" /LENGTH=129 /DNA_ID=CAMNT_0012872007 /DNA_START=383 /DNA_END=772 /DNA_ORIENTATION=-
MGLWHPTDEASLDALLNAEIDLLDMHGQFIKKVHVLNKGIVHLIDDIFWNCGFKTESHCEQVRADLGLPDHVWVEKRAAIAKRVDDLGDQFRPAMRKGWLDYIQQTYVADADDYDAAMGQGDLVVPDDP